MPNWARPDWARAEKYQVGHGLIGPEQGLLEIISIGRIVNDSKTSY